MQKKTRRTLSDSSVYEHQQNQDSRRGAHPQHAAKPASYSTSLSTFAHYNKQRVKRINTRNSSVHGGRNEKPTPAGSAD